VKKYLPEPHMVPAMLALGFIGAVIGLKALPALANWLASKTPTLTSTPTAP
jgi:hypothetical protein